MSESRDEVLEFVRDALSSYQFQSKTEAEKLEAVERILAHPLLIDNNVGREDVMLIYQEQINRSTIALASFGRDPLMLVLLASKPKDTLSLCETSPAFARLCADPNTFRVLLARHYPSAFETANPRNQYTALANGFETIYLLERDDSLDEGDDGFWETFKPPVQLAPTQKPWLLPGWKYKPDLSSPHFWLRMMGPGYIPAVYSNFIGKFMMPGYKLSLSLETTPQNFFLPLRIVDSVKKRKFNSGDDVHEVLGLQLSIDEIEKLFEAGKLTDSELVDGKPEGLRSNHDKNVVFVVKGNPIPRGTWAWLLIWQSNTALMDDEVTVYKTKEELVADFVKDNFENLLDILIDEFKDTSEEYPDLPNEVIAGSKAFNDYLVQQGHLAPFTRDNMTAYCMASDHFFLHPDPNFERNRWLFRHVQF